ncbi:MAG TPA: DMT family transporter [Agriterribacter sp.]|nr:DMT family transporter [Agriterribacter sp.]
MEEKEIANGEKGNSRGWISGFIGMLMFSGSLPATRIAVLGLPPLFVTGARAVIAGLLAIGALILLKEKWPAKSHIFPLMLVALGVVVGFPLLSALALQYITSAHSLVFVGLLPLATAIFGVMLGHERPKPAFWLFSFTGSLLVVGFAIFQGIQVSAIGDILMMGAIILCGLGYALGAKLTKTMGGWQVISWALTLSFPLMFPFIFLYPPSSITTVPTGAWIGLAYISLFSMFIGFIFWYQGLAQGGIASVGQLQLLQPFFGLGLAAFFLHEKVSPAMLLISLGVMLCVAGSRRFS